MKLSIDFVTGDDEALGVISEALGALIDRTVDLSIPDNSGYPAANVHVLRVDADGDLVVCETDHRGSPIEGSTWAIPQHVIRHVRVPLGEAA